MSWLDGLSNIPRIIGNVLTDEELDGYAPDFSQDMIIDESGAFNPNSSMKPKTKKVASPFARGLGGALQFGIDAAATPNIAYGGATDIFRGLQAAGDSKLRRDQLALQNARQRMGDQLSMQEYHRKVSVDDERERHNRGLEQAASRRADITANSDAQRLQMEREKQAAALAKEARAREDWLPVPIPENMRQHFGGKDVIRVPPNEFDTTFKALNPEAKGRNLHFESHTNEITGTVVSRAIDAQTGEIVKVYTHEGEAKKRPPQPPQGPQGTFIPIVDENGNITGAWNPTTNETRQAPAPNMRRTPLAASTKKEIDTIEGMVKDLTTVVQLGEKHKDAIGPAAGRWEGVKQATVGVGPEVNFILRTTGDLADRLLRERSGAAITEGEAERLKKLVPDPNTPYKTFHDNAVQFLTYLQEMLGRRRGGQSLAPTGSSVPMVAPRQAAPVQGQQPPQALPTKIRDKKTRQIVTGTPESIKAALDSGRYEAVQ